MPMDLHSDVWREIVVVHNHTKTISLLAEENDRDFKNYFHPIKEQRDALEHIVRATASDKGLLQGPLLDNPDSTVALRYAKGAPEDYSRRSLDKALGHEYRAFFDAADWYGVRLREKIVGVLNGFAQSCIATVLPDYYNTIRPDIERICKEIASIRGSKDISRDTIMANVERYKTALDTLNGYYDRISMSVTSMVDWTKREHSREKKSIFWKIAAPVIASGLTALIYFVINWCRSPR